jgi:hypothetical protein
MEIEISAPYNCVLLCWVSVTFKEQPLELSTCVSVSKDWITTVSV